MARKPTRTERLTRASRQVAKFARADLTTVRAEGVETGALHLAFDHGTHESVPLCGALAGRETETYDGVSHCGDCAWVVRDLDLEYRIKDADGWTGLYLPRGSRSSNW